MFAESSIPPSWKTAAIIPLYKGKGDRSDPSNYRPISLTPIISKIFERFLYNRVLPYYINISDKKFGFRAKKIL